MTSTENYDDDTLRMAAIAAVMAMLDSQGEDPAQAGRKSGSTWAQDNRRINMGRSSLLRNNSSRSPWR